MCDHAQGEPLVEHERSRGKYEAVRKRPVLQRKAYVAQISSAERVRAVYVRDKAARRGQDHSARRSA